MRRETTPSATPNKSELRLQKENQGIKGNQQQPKAPGKRTKVYGQEENTPAGSANIRQMLGQARKTGSEKTPGPGNERNRGGRTRTGSDSNAGGSNRRGERKKTAQPGAKQSSNSKTISSRRRAPERNDTKKQRTSV